MATVRLLLPLGLILASQAELTKFTTQVEKAPWRARAIPAGGLYNGTFYVMGGRNHIVHFESDIWKSSDGVNWERVKRHAEFGARGYMDSVILKNGTMVLIGGQDLLKCYSDVWVSHDFAQTWTKVLDNAPWGLTADGKQVGRSAYKTLVLEDDTILLFSGDYGSFFSRSFWADVWASHDGGRSWNRRFNAADLPAGTPSWQPRAGMQVVKIDDTIYFMGGDNDDYSTFTFKRFNDMWKSTDLGASWQYIGLAPWGNRTGHQCFSLDNKCIHCIGGQGCPACNKGKNLLYSDLWKTCDGAKSWKRVANGLFDCDPDKECNNCGADDMLTRLAPDGKVWMMGADREKSAPFPMSNSVWTIEDDGKATNIMV
jgi:hypothetical protein